MRLKFWFEFDRFDRCLIASRSIEGIFDWSNLIFNQSKIVKRVFENFKFSRVQSLSNFFKTLFSLSLVGQGFQSLFLSFSSNFFKGFCPLRPIKTFIPFLFHLFSSFMHFCHAYWENSEPIENRGFCWFKPFLSKLIIGILLRDDINMILGN